MSAFRVILKVDERDMADVAVGQHGNILLSAFPHDPIAFQVEKITPVSTAKEGRTSSASRPSCSAGRHAPAAGHGGGGQDRDRTPALLWIWTHQAIDSLRLMLWKWLP